jgi:hypothetical protein
MVMKLNSLARWAVLPAGSAIVFEGRADAEKRVRLSLNLEAVTSFFIRDKSGHRFLCTCGPGLEVIEFSVAGSFDVFPEEKAGIVQYHCAAHEEAFTVVDDPKIFTKIASRRSRNPEMEEIMYRMNANMERRLAMQTSEMEAAFAARMRSIENERAPVDTRAAADTGKAPQSAKEPAGEIVLDDAGGEADGGGA